MNYICKALYKKRPRDTYEQPETVYVLQFVFDGASGSAIVARADGKLSVCGLRHLRVAKEDSGEISWYE